MWRIKWHPYDDNRLLLGAMHGGCRFVTIQGLVEHVTIMEEEKLNSETMAEEGSTSNFKIIVEQEFTKHKSMAYGADWLVGVDDISNRSATTSSSSSSGGRGSFNGDGVHEQVEEVEAKCETDRSGEFCWDSSFKTELILWTTELPFADFYEGLSGLRDVQMITTGLNFQSINTRGFASIANPRMVQIIDGVDNAPPGLNFAAGNMIGISPLDVAEIEVVSGASSALYGPNAFNGVISMETRDPFFHTGLSAMVKVGERNMLKTAVRYANTIANKDGNDWMAYKFNVE